jgi:hypothetical protein
MSVTGREETLTKAQRGVRRAGVAVGGGATILLGIALIPLPGPGTLVIIAGLSILGREFPAAEKTAHRARSTARRIVGSVRRSPD